jgi:hypothetical protein
LEIGTDLQKLKERISLEMESKEVMTLEKNKVIVYWELGNGVQDTDSEMVS